MSRYPVLEQDGYCASVLTEREANRRWRAWVHFERGSDFARLKGDVPPSHRVPLDYPSEAAAVSAAYEHARVLIAQKAREDASAAR